MTEPVVVETVPIPCPTVAVDQLSDEQKAQGITMMCPQWGLKMMVEPNGLHVPPHFNAEASQEVRDRFELRSHDVVITTYPKCGTAWMQNILYLLRFGSDNKENPLHSTPWLEASASFAANKINTPMSPSMTVDEMLALPEPEAEQSGFRAWKTHSPLGLVPWKGGVGAANDVGAKLIIVSRNPKDGAVSKFHHIKNMGPMLGFNGNWDDFVPLYLDGRVTYNSFWKWHRDWWIAKESYPETILWLHYEDMKKDLEKKIRKIVTFLNIEKADEEIKKVAHRCTFEVMKAESKARNDGASKKNHYRSGKTGGWVDVMSPEVVSLFDEKTKELYSECSLRFQERPE